MKDVIFFEGIDCIGKTSLIKKFAMFSDLKYEYHLVDRGYLSSEVYNMKFARKSHDKNDLKEFQSNQITVLLTFDETDNVFLETYKKRCAEKDEDFDEMLDDKKMFEILSSQLNNVITINVNDYTKAQLVHRLNNEINNLERKANNG